MPIKLEVPPGLAKEVADKLGCKTDAVVPFLEISLQNCLLFDIKQQDYGPGNIARFGTFGCVVRMSDKLERLNNLTGVKFSPEQRELFKQFRNHVKFIEENEHTLTLVSILSDLNGFMDKLRALFLRRRKRTVNESIMDSFRDGANYNLIAVMIEKGQWPGLPKEGK